MNNHFESSPKDYTYSAVQDGSLCFCADNFGAYGRVPDSQCDVPCLTDPTKICGGRLRNSVFETGVDRTGQLATVYYD